MRIGIIGGGAIGLLVSALLGLDRHQVTLYVKSEEQLKKLKENFLIIEPEDRKVKVDVRHISNLTNKDLLLICVKQHQLRDVMPYLKTTDSPLLFLQNGMGHTNLLDQLKKVSPIFLGVIEHGAFRKEDNTVVHTGIGRIKVAAYKPGNTIRLKDLASKLNSDRFPVVVEKDWYDMLVDKLVINAVVNPLTAIFNVNNGALLINRELKAMMYILTEEVCEVLKVDFESHWQRMISICHTTADNSSSMRVDLNNNRKTEIESISGFLLEKATEKHKYIHFTYHAIKAIERKGSL